MNGGFVMPVRAIVATIAFTIIGLMAFLFVPAPWVLRWPNAGFYAVLILNTFFSVGYFDALPPGTATNA